MPDARQSLTIELGGDVSRVPQLLGTATTAILAGRASALILDFGENAVSPSLLGPLLRWAKRNEMVLRTRICGIVFVVPRTWHALQWRLAMLLERPPVRTVIVATRARALEWVAAHGA